jgi:hypothetical protein
MLALVTTLARGEQSQTIRSAAASGLPIRQIGCGGSIVPSEDGVPPVACSACRTPGVRQTVPGSVVVSARRLFGDQVDALSRAPINLDHVHRAFGEPSFGGALDQVKVSHRKRHGRANEYGAAE